MSLIGLSLIVAWLIPISLALVQLSESFGPIVVACATVAISMATLAAYGLDKHQATKGGWRIPEMTLHWLELLGGWPAAFVAQRLFRHKTAKRSYQWKFWVIGLLHQGLALVYLSR